MFVGAALTLALLAFGALSLTPIFDRDTQVASGGWIRVMTVEEARAQDISYVEEHRVFVVVRGATFVGLSAWSPHPGPGNKRHREFFCEQSQLFDGAHGEKFDRFGHYFGGPAPRGMDRVAVRVVDGWVEINPSDVTEGPPRAENGGPKSLPPQGPFCVFESSAESPPGFLEDDDAGD